MNKLISISTILALLVILGGGLFALLTGSSLDIERAYSEQDADNDGIDDYSDILEGARSQIGVVTEYDTSYYSDGGYPPDYTGACADVLWRSLAEAGYDLPELIASDIAQSASAYASGNLGDDNINYRRVQNLEVYMSRYIEELTTELIPGDVTNLSQWQAGDIVTFEQIPGGLWHIAIVSDKRRSDGVPYLIHNHGYGVQENDYLLRWPTDIAYHYRWKYD